MHPSEIGKTCGPFAPRRREATVSVDMDFSARILERLVGYRHASVLATLAWVMAKTSQIRVCLDTTEGRVYAGVAVRLFYSTVSVSWQLASVSYPWQFWS